MAKILIIDDSNMLREMLKYTLVEGGYSDITEAIDGKDGVEKATQEQFKLIITDINMPIMDGFELIKTIRTFPNYKTTPILVLTTEKTDEMKQKGKSAGATGWIVKPFLPDQLLQAVNLILNKQG